MNAALQPSALDYARIFEAERTQSYPTVDAFEQRCGHALARNRLEGAARVLACPIKANPPNWQHGRVLYSAARLYFESASMPMNVIDIGTAKGFSALCLVWALTDAGREGRVVSVDVIDPKGTDRRNTVAELDGPVTLTQILEPWPEALGITFLKSTGIERLRRSADRIHVAFVDGKHDGAVVATEARLLTARQATGDLAIFDDAQIPAIAEAIQPLQEFYRLQHLTAKIGRSYVIARRR